MSRFTPLEETALLTLYARALDSRLPRPILGDSDADRIAASIDYDFTGLGLVTSVVCQAALRTKMLDDRVRMFTAAHPNAVVVDLGAGLDDGMSRLDGPPTVDWYSVDLPAVIALRDSVLHGNPRAHSVPRSLTDERWLEAIPAERPTMLIANGLLAFLNEQEIVSLLRRVTGHFRSGELAFNDYGRIGWVSRFAVKLAPQRMFKAVSGQWSGYPGFKDAHRPEVWNPRLQLIEETSLAHAPEVELFPTWLRMATHLAGRIPSMARKARILRYSF
ncbi:class I SAM-dependent methyltransferase [Arthrobacter sp. ok362]|uniref:class I SAM-dependent methyltransferase n=1 Tax=Arthrobacter sp. ok362 TaxID=1761745 RepID=UPI001C31BAB8|nr:class I SAM-dependent methyltransferase [Arthrobacter sp. ok362]